MKKKLAVIGAALLCCAAVAVAMWQSGTFTQKPWQEKTEVALERTAAYTLEQTAESAQLADDTAAMWAVMALCRSDIDLPEEYLADYIAALEAKLQACQGDLIGESSKFNTEYARMILTVTAAGYDASNFAGFDLTVPLADFEETTRQGINGAAYALLALDSGHYDCPVRQSYVDYIVEAQLDDGGWALGSYTNADADITSIVLQALAKYQDQPAAATAVQAGVVCLSNLQLDNGGFKTMGAENPESCAQAILALCELGVDIEDPRFVKNGNSALEAMLHFQQRDGSFSHLADQTAITPVSAYQSMMAMVSLLRCDIGANPFYTMP